MITNKKINEEITSTELSEILVEAIQDRKGQRIVSLDLREIDEASADYYIICQGTSSTQVSSIAENIIDEAYLQAKERPIGKAGFAVGEWVVVDFFNVVVHIFLEPVRTEYALEDLWGDAKIKVYEEVS